jgi:predicted membrane protein DUF2232
MAPSTDRADSRAHWEMAWAAALPAALIAGSFLVPGIGVLAAFLWPLGVAVLVRWSFGHGTGALAVGLCAVLVTAILSAILGWGAGLGVGAGTVLLTGLPVFFAGRVRRGLDASSAFLGLCVAGIALFEALLLARPAIGEAPLGTLLATFLDANIPLAVESWRRSKVDAATLEQMQASALQMRNLVVRYWPGLFALGWVLASAVTFYVGAWAARPAAAAQSTRFERLQIPAAVAALFVLAGAGFGLIPGITRSVAGDVLLALASLYFVAGLSIICHFARAWFRAPVVRLGLYVLVAYPPMNLGVALLGLFDWYVKFRRRGEKE